jgi:hypothetical protein
MAVEVSTKQMALTRDAGPGGYMERQLAMLAQTATNVLSEAASTAHHAARATYAQRVVTDPPTANVTAAPQIVMGVNIIQSTTYDDVTKTSTCTVSDLGLQAQIMALWDALAGIDTAA